MSTVSATPSSPGPAVDTSADNSLGPVQFTHAAKLTLAVATTAVVGSILVLTRLWGLGTTPEEILPGEQAFVLIARQIEIEGWIGLSHGILDGTLPGYAYVLAFWTALVGDEIGMVRLLSGIASLASVGVSYFLIAMLFNRRVALFATVLIVAGIWPLTYARLALPMSLLLLVEVCSPLSAISGITHDDRRVITEEPACPVRGARRTQPISRLCGDCVCSGSVCACGRGAMFRVWSAQESWGERFAAFAIPALIISLPFWAAAATDASLRDDAKALLITETPRYLQSDGVMGQLRTVTGNIVNTGRALIWSTSADEFEQGGGRIVDPLTGLLVLIGLLVCVREMARRFLRGASRPFGHSSYRSWPDATRRHVWPPRHRSAP